MSRRRTHPAPSLRVAAAWVVALGALVGACETSVEPNLGINQPFTLWGLFNPKVDTQAVRIFEIEETIRRVQPGPIDATVRVTELETGTMWVWQDSVVQLADGDYRHVYWAAARAKHEHTYRLEVERSDGATSWAEVAVPPPVELEVDADGTPGESVVPVSVRGDPPAFPRIDVEYNVVSVDREGRAIFNPVTISYLDRPRRSADGWAFGIDLREDYLKILSIFDDLNLPLSTIEVRDMELRVHVGNEEWAAPGGTFDADVLVEPGLLSNVQNGFGFVGAGYVEAVRFRPATELLRRAGFSP